MTSTSRRTKPQRKASLARAPETRRPTLADVSTTGRWLGAVLVVLVTLAVFTATLQNEFVNWDDDLNLVDNPEFRGLAWTQLRWMFTTTLLGHWIPLTWVTFGADYLLWGMNPRGYHLTSLLFHTAAAVVFYVVALRLLPATSMASGVTRIVGATAAALYFAVHPLRVESVAWATERRDVVSGLWFLLTILTYLKAAAAAGATRRRWLAGSIGCFALAAMSKAIVMTLPAVLVILDVYPLNRVGTTWRQWTARASRPVWIEKIPYLLVACAVAGVTAYAQRGLSEPLAARPLVDRLAVACYGLWFYLWKTVLPFPVSPFYEIPARVDPLAAPLLASAVAVVAITAVLFWLRRRWPAGLAVWLSYVVLLAPVSGIAQSGPQLVAARYSYLPCLGLALLIGTAVSLLAHRSTTARRGRGWARLGAATAVLYLVVLGIRSWEQTHVWHDSETLWSYVASLDPAATIPHNNLAALYVARGRLDAAEREARRAIELGPEFEDARTNLAAALAKQGRLEEAGEARAQLGYLLLKHGKFEAAVQLFRKEVQARPGDPAAHNNLGTALLLRRDVQPAIAEFERALEINPSYEKARRNLAAARAAR